MKDILEEEIKQAIKALSLPEVSFIVERGSGSRGDYAANAALILDKKTGEKPEAIAGRIAGELKARLKDKVEKIEVAGGGFINFYLPGNVFIEAVGKANEEGDNYGRSNQYGGKKVMVEYTDPNPFKLFHIGHLMSNAVGESVSRLFSFGGAEVKRANYQGDVGLHVAKAIWGLMKNGSNAECENIESLGRAYALGAKSYEEDKQIKMEIEEINRKVYFKDDSTVNEIYEKGRKASLDYFEKIYAKLDTSFDYYFFESEAAERGKKLVEENIGKIFEKSDGAVIYKGEKNNLHTRVFMNKDGLPTYEAKELALAEMKNEKFSYDLSVVVTGNEIKEYFKVLLSALSEIYPHLAKKTVHLPHGMLRLPSGKISSRAGDVLSAEWLINEVKKKISERIGLAQEKKIVSEDILEETAVAAVKYSILKQAVGRDIIFDFDKSLSFSGDSGPYLQYTHARAASVLAKAGETGNLNKPEKAGELERLIFYFPEEVERAIDERAPHRIVTYLNELAQSFNVYYAKNRIIDSEAREYRLALASAARAVLCNGLQLLGITAPDRM